MAKMLALTDILMPDGNVVPRKTVFDATPQQARQFDALKSARPATKEEIAAASRDQAVKDGQNPDEPMLPMMEQKAPPSNAPGDPLATPKGKSA